MGRYDTIIFERPIPCSKCGTEIRSDQIKAFEGALHEYRIGDCIAHAEEIRVVEDELYCEECQAYTTRYYLAVYRGVLVGIEQDPEVAEALLRGFNFEKLLLWYHDLYRKRQALLADNRRTAAFMRNVCEWFERGYDRMAPEDEPIRRWLFIWDRKLLEQSQNPLAAIRGFLAERAVEEGASAEAGQLSLW